MPQGVPHFRHPLWLHLHHGLEVCEGLGVSAHSLKDSRASARAGRDNALSSGNTPVVPGAKSGQAAHAVYQMDFLTALRQTSCFHVRSSHPKAF